MELPEYFRLKDAYERKLAQKKKRIRSNRNIGDRERRQKFEMLTHECVNCKKEGGTTFRVDKTHYYAKCGASPPCALDVQIQRVPVSSVRQEELALEDNVGRIKSGLIETNMDHLYKFADEDATLKRGESLRKDLQTTVDELVALRKGLERNVPQIAKLEALFQTEVAALRAEEDGHADRYVTSIRPVVEQLREAKYKYADVEFEVHPHTKKVTMYLIQKGQTLDDYYR